MDWLTTLITTVIFLIGYLSNIINMLDVSNEELSMEIAWILAFFTAKSDLSMEECKSLAFEVF